MLTFQLDRKERRPLKVLCLGAHSDDIEIGCGGTILNLTKQQRNVVVYWVVFSANERRKQEAEESANALLTDAKRKTVIVKEFRDGFFPYVGAEIKEYFEELKRELDPDIVFTHHRLDMHQDHRLVSDLTWNTFRNHLILEYEIPKYDGDFGSPNVFVHVDEAIVAQKIQHIYRVFKSQAEHQWFTEETFRSTLRLRGIESNAPSGYAEAFYSRKLILS